MVHKKYFRILKVNGKIEVHCASCFDLEYRTFFVSENIETHTYDLFESKRYAEYKVYKTCLNDIEDLFNRMKKILSEKDYELFLSRFDECYYTGFLEDYNIWLAERDEN